MRTDIAGQYKKYLTPMRTITYDMKQLLVEAARSAFVIPRFQRDFIWHAAQVKLLIDSVARNYPIGSLLLLTETDPRSPFLSSRPVQALLNGEGDDSIPTTSNDPSARYYVLDGQQRLTSIVRVLLQGWDEQYYYFDLRKLKSFNDSTPTTDWIISRARTRPMSSRYLRSDSIIDRERCQVLVEEYFEAHDEQLRSNRPAQRAASAKANRVFETIRNFQVPLVVIDRSESTEAICRIFETINSTGTRLTTFDLAVARFFPEPDLHALWEKSRQTHDVFERYEVDGERVLQVIALQVSREKGAYAEATRGALLGLDKAVVSERWQSASDLLSAAYRWAEERGVAPRMFANEALLIPLAVFFSLINDSWKGSQPGYSSHLERWYLASCMQQGARQASNYRIAEATGELLRWLSDGIPPEIPKVTLTPEMIERLRPTDTRYRAILAFMRTKCPKDLWTDEFLLPTEVEDHHIFPAACAKKHGLDRGVLDSLGNRLLVTKSSNRTLSDRLPRDYIGQLIGKASGSGMTKDRMDRLQSAGIVLPLDNAEALDALDVPNATKFIKARTQQIYEMIAVALGDALQRDPLDDDEDD